MKSIEIFYHLHIPTDWRLSLWAQYLDGQINVIKKARLWNISKFNLCISMPMYLTQLPGFTITANNSNISIPFYKKIEEYVNLRYPTVNIIEIRDLNQPNLYEGQTLRWLWKKSIETDCNFLYLHSKGISNYSPVAVTDNWRQILDHFIIENWDTNLQHLTTHDVVGVRDRISLDLALSGNFWWSNSQYISTLPNPLDINSYIIPDPRISSRYAYERWVTSNHPKVYYTVDTKTDHYQEYCFLENLIK